jgi:hypothetical protein
MAVAGIALLGKVGQPMVLCCPIAFVNLPAQK